MPTISEPFRTRDWAGSRARRIVRYTGPVSYPAAGGDPFPATAAFLGAIESFGASDGAFADDAAGANPRLMIFSQNPLSAGDGVVRWFVPNTGNEVAGGTNLSGYSVDVEVIGKG
jgi:hypothetical protein